MRRPGGIAALARLLALYPCDRFGRIGIGMATHIILEFSMLFV
jgi:hypothetical protein